MTWDFIEKQGAWLWLSIRSISFTLSLSQRVNHMWYQRVLLQGNWWSQFLIHWCHLVMVAPLLANWAKLKLVVGLWEGGALLGWVRGGSACSASALNKLHSICSSATAIASSYSSNEFWCVQGGVEVHTYLAGLGERTNWLTTCGACGVLGAAHHCPPLLHSLGQCSNQRGPYLETPKSTTGLKNLSVQAHILHPFVFW